MMQYFLNICKTLASQVCSKCIVSLDVKTGTGPVCWLISCSVVKVYPITFFYLDPGSGKSYFRSPSMIYTSQQQLINVKEILSDGATTLD